MIKNKEARIRPLYFHWSVKMNINNVNISESDPFISSGNKNDFASYRIVNKMELA
ncbi:MAG: hypothetical protein ACJ72F_07645 [Nitrososphaeraceae archaeon]